MASYARNHTNINNRDEDVEEWSNEMCLRIANEDNFPTKVKDLSVQKDIINRFINFYLSGKVQKGLSARDIIFAVISIMPLTNGSEKLIWKDSNYSDDGTLFFLTPECQLKYEIKHVLMKHEQNIVEDKFKKPEVHNEQSNETTVLDDEQLTDDSKLQTSDIDVSLGTDVRDDKVSPGESPKDFTDDLKFQTNDDGDKSHSEGTNDNAQPVLLDKLSWFRKKPLYTTKEKVDSQVIKPPNMTCDPVKNAAFCIFCNKLLAQWNDNANARLKLKCFFGVVALTLMRSIVKSYKHVIQVFMKDTFRYKFAAYTGDLPLYSPPSEMCVRKTFKTFRKTDRKTQIMFAKLVINSFIVEKMKKETSMDILNAISINIFNATVLAPTSNYGMEIINMLQDVAQFFVVSFDIFRSEETAVSWNKINKFLNKHLSTYPTTCYWARVIDKEQFKYLTCENNYELAVVLAVFIESSTRNSVVWNSRWVKSGTDLEKYKQLGQKIVNCCKMYGKHPSYGQFKKKKTAFF